MWLEALAEVQADIDAGMRDDAYELFVVESARSRLVDRTGRVRLTLRGDRTLEGAMGGEGLASVDGHLWLTEATGRRLLIRTDAVVSIHGAERRIRDESGSSQGTSIGAWLREAWTLDDRLCALLPDGTMAGDRLVHVGADHVDLAKGRDVTTVPWVAVEAWMRG